MSRQQLELIRRAREMYRDIYPCSTKSSLEECFTILDNRCLFWFNTADNSTHMVVSESAEER